MGYKGKSDKEYQREYYLKNKKEYQRQYYIKLERPADKRQDSAWSCFIYNFHACPARFPNRGARPRPGC